MCMCPGDHYDFLRKRRSAFQPCHFISGSIQLTSNSKKQLTEIGLALQSDTLANKKWFIVGHADSIGSLEQRNLELSRRRSESVRDYLVNKCNLDEKSFSIKCFGQIWPLDSNSSEVGRGQNRRVEIILDE